MKPVQNNRVIINPYLNPRHSRRRGKSCLIGGTLLVMLLVLLPGTVRADDWNAIIEDTFAVKPPARTEGSPLAGSTTEKGACVWRSSGNDSIFQLSADGHAVNGNGEGGKTIALVDCAPAGSSQIKLEGDLRPGGSDWLGIGFSGSDNFFWNGGHGGQLWLTIKGSRAPIPEGKVDIYANGASIMIKSVGKEDYGFDPAKPTHVEMIYNPSANTVSVSLNGKSVVENYLLKNFKPAIKTAGIMTNYPVANDTAMQVGDFKVSVHTAK